jgi:hypothetical protein
LLLRVVDIRFRQRVGQLAKNDIGQALFNSSMCNTPEESDYISIKERIAPSFDLKKATDDEIKQQRLHLSIYR